nr:hypothetical protein BgiMline_034484 [Biomphalaria glabrata]
MLLTCILVSLRETLLPRLRPLANQPVWFNNSGSTHVSFSHTRAGVFFCLKAVVTALHTSPLRVSPHPPRPELKAFQAEVPGVSPPRGILILVTLVPAYLQGTSNWLPEQRSFNLPHPEVEP